MNSVYSVGQVNTYIKNMFTQDFLLNKIYIKGEVSNCKYHTSGHIYFSLKDETGAMACVMFAGSRKGLAFQMKNGDKVIVGGSVNVYERDGKYQLYAKEITLEGAGLLYERYLALKRELEEMGMFAQDYKQPIPKHIRTLGGGHSAHRSSRAGYQECGRQKKSIRADHPLSCPCTGRRRKGEHCKGNPNAG